MIEIALSVLLGCVIGTLFALALLKGGSRWEE